MESSVHNVWIDHNTLFASGAEDEGYDSLIDMKAGTNYVTVSYNTLRNSGRGRLVGSSDSDLGNGPVTFHHNLYENKVDNNYFKNSADVFGTFYTDLMGSWHVSGNIFDNVTWTADGTENHPAGPNPTSNTSISIPYAYSLDPANCVPSVVTATAGAGTGLQVSNGSCTPTSPTAGPTTPTPTPTQTQPSGTNLSIGAGADGSSKASGTSYGNVVDGDLSTYWSPNGATGSFSVKWSSAQTVARINVREASGSSIGSWQVLNGDTGAVLKTGSGAGAISFTTTSLKKIAFTITSSSGTPKSPSSRLSYPRFDEAVDLPRQ